MNFIVEIIVNVLKVTATYRYDMWSNSFFSAIWPLYVYADRITTIGRQCSENNGESPPFNTFR